MAFQYVGNYGAPEENIYEMPQQQQQQPAGGMPMGGLSALKQFMPAAGGASASGASAGSSAGSTAGSLIGGGGGGSAAGGGASSLSAAGPWALLAAVIIANESEAQKAGRRDESRTTRAQDMITGKVLEQDTDYYGDKVGGIGGEFIKFGGKMGNPEGVFNLLKKGSLLRKLF